MISRIDTFSMEIIDGESVRNEKGHDLFILLNNRTPVVIMCSFSSSLFSMRVHSKIGIVYSVHSLLSSYNGIRSAFI